MAVPSLCSIIRGVLEAKQVQTQAIQIYLDSIKSIKRYDNSFGLFWAFCKFANLQINTANLEQVAGALLEFNKFERHHARNAYAAVLLIPGMEHLRFSPS